MKSKDTNCSDGFSRDPLGYSALAWHKWGMLATENGFPVDISKSPTIEDLKNPLLWLSHAHALSEAAVLLVRTPPVFEHMPPAIRAICDSQYHAVALMLVGYSLEVCLKAMTLIKIGQDTFIEREKDFFNHKLEKLADFIPGLSDKDIATLKGLSHYVVWAGRYPDPGSKKINNMDDIFDISEKYKINARDLFGLSARIMGHVRSIIG